MKYYIYLLMIIFAPAFLPGQSLTKARIERLKHSIGKISIDGDPSTGTGFFINDQGAVVTCWHVVEPAFIKDSTGKFLGVKKINIEMYDGQKKELQLPVIFLSNLNLNKDAVLDDFCLLLPAPIPFNTKVEYLKLGNFDDIQEGDEVYTCGYPLGLPYQFISRGTLSTKYIDSTIIFKRAGMPDEKMKKSVALLDLTLNKGNSGGPIIKLGKTPEEDEVVGIADFLINPFGQNAQQLSDELNKGKMNIILPSGLSLTDAMKLFSTAIIYSSNGISGCVSINHFLQALR